MLQCNNYKLVLRYDNIENFNAEGVPQIISFNKMIECLNYSSFTLTWIIVNDFQVEFFSFNHRKQWKLSVCKKDINQVRVNEL